jgi:hypothetical protein
LAALNAAAWVSPGHAQTKLPDWSGIWIPDVAGQSREEAVNVPPWTPRAAARIARQTADMNAGRPWGLFADCLPEGMPAWMLISHNAMEILFTPGRVTLLGESDGNRLRRIYTDGRSHPKDPDPSFHGDSVGHWDGDTLVVDTVAILPEALLAVSEAHGVPNGGDMHIVERLHVGGGDILFDDLEITAPHILTRPWTTTRRFQRQRGPTAEIEEGVCRQGDFTESKDADGFAVFSPLKNEGGNPVAPPLDLLSKDKAP